MAMAIVFDNYRWNIVPLEPADAQLDEARQFTSVSTDELRRIYRAMVVSAPPCPRLPFTGPPGSWPEP
jgi:hypothetical protein